MKPMSIFYVVYLTAAVAGATMISEEVNAAKLTSFLSQFIY